MNFSRSNFKILNNTSNTKYLGQNTSKYCSQMIVVHVHANGFVNGIEPGSNSKRLIFSKVHPACHNIANGMYTSMIRIYPPLINKENNKHISSESY